MDRLEIEIKAYLDDITLFKGKLREIGAELQKEIEEFDQYYNHPSKNFIETDEALRIRKEGDSLFFTYKGPKLGTRGKSRIEEETIIEDYDSMEKILLHLGFIKSGTVFKKRTLYLYNRITICIDDVKNLGLFVELEKIGTERESIENELFELADKLGLDRFERRSYVGLLSGDEG